MPRYRGTQTRDSSPPDADAVSVTRRGLRGTATFSDDGDYRYILERHWRDRGTRLLFVMFNPSTADENVLDPTLRRCANFAAREGYGGMLIGNIFALRSPRTAIIHRHRDPVGPENDRFLEVLASVASGIVVAWGAGVSRHSERVAEVVAMLRVHGPLRCLGTTKGGHPRHPLYLAKTTPLEAWEGRSS